MATIAILCVLSASAVNSVFGAVKGARRMPLVMVLPGQRVRLLRIRAGRGLQARLAAMGLVPGVELEVISRSIRGPFVVAVKDSRVMLGRGMVHKMEVE